jgi:hypothetical protein
VPEATNPSFALLESGSWDAYAEEFRESGRGLLIVNADDWGRDSETTIRTLECIARGAVSSVSAMVFMADSERAAAVAREKRIDAGLHLNLTASFSGQRVSGRLVEHQQRTARFLSRHRIGTIVFHPGLTHSFEYVVKSQLEEFARLYGSGPERIDGHHHSHLCANVVLGKLLPTGVIVRRNFSFRPGEKSIGNRLYRRFVDCLLASRHRLTDFFYSLPPMEPKRLRRIFWTARRAAVELETHAVNQSEYRFLTSGELFRQAGNVLIASSYASALCSLQSPG